MSIIDELKEKISIDEKMEVDRDYYSASFYETKKFLQEKLIFSPFRRKNAKELVEHLDLIINATCSYNSDWIFSDLLTSQPNFLENFKINIKYFRYKEELIDFIINHIYIYLNNEKKNDFFSNDFLEYLSTLDINQELYNSLFLKLEDEKQFTFLKYLMANKEKLEYLNYNFKDNTKSFIQDNVLLFAMKTNALYDLRNICEDNNNAIKILDEYIDRNQDTTLLAIYSLVSRRLNICSDSFKEIFKLILFDVMKNENAKFSDISFSKIDAAYSTVIYVKDKVIKVGNKRGTYKFHNNPYIVKPLLRKIFDIDGERYVIEVTERVDNKTFIKSEQIRNLYNKFRDIGLVWTDVKDGNVGILLKDNIIYWNKEINPSDDVLGLDSYIGTNELKKGDIVLLDADYIFNEDDSSIRYPDEGKVRRLEEMYQEEKKTKML